MKHSVRSITSVWTVLVIVMCVRAETRVEPFKYEQPREIPSSFGINAKEPSNYVEIIHCFGEFAGFRPHVSFMPDHRIGIVVLVNESNESTFFPDLVAADIYDHLLSKKPLHVDPNPRVRRLLNELQKEREALEGSEEDRGPARIQMSAGPNAYTGTFESDELGKIVVGFDGNKLHATFGSLSSQLAHQSAETFRVDFKLLSPVNITFKVKEGTVTELSLIGRTFVRR